MASSSLDIIQTVPRVATLIYQAHQLWQEFQDVPDGIMGLVEHLKALEPMFCEIEAQFSQEHASAAFKNSLELSRRAHNSLAALVNEMRTQLHSKKALKRKCAAVKVMMKKSALERLEQGLSRCLTLLQIAIQAYQMAMLLRFDPDTIARRVTSELHLHQQPAMRISPTPQLYVPVQQTFGPKPQWNEPQNEYEEKATEISLAQRPKKRPESYTWYKYGRFALAYAKATGAWQAKFQLPSWLSTSAWEIISAPAMAGWTYTYRVYNIVPNDAEIFTKVRNGDVAGVLELFTTGRASPFDTTKNGFTLLDTATLKSQYEVCQLLLQMGLHFIFQDTTHRGAGLLEYVSESVVSDSISRRWDKNTPSRQIARLFVSYVQEPDALPADILLDFVREWAADDKSLVMFRELFMPKYYLRPLRDRLEAARLGAFNVLSFKTFSRLLSQDGTVTKHEIGISSRERLSIVHSAAVGFASRYPEWLLPYRKPWCWLSSYNQDWGEFVTRVASAAAPEDLHSIELVVPWDAYEVTTWRGTPLTSVLGGVVCYLSPHIPFNLWDNLFHGSLRHWLTLLQAAGVDLLEYGKREASILHDPLDNIKGAFDADAIERSRSIPRRRMTEGSPRPKLHRSWGEPGDMYWLPFRIIDLKIGPCPSDWRILWAPEFEYMACQFWKLVEKEEDMMPGAWVED